MEEKIIEHISERNFYLNLNNKGKKISRTYVRGKISDWNKLIMVTLRYKDEAKLVQNNEFGR